MDAASLALSSPPALLGAGQMAQVTGTLADSNFSLAFFVSNISNLAFCKNIIVLRHSEDLLFSWIFERCK